MYCKYCGKELAEDEICTCKTSNHSEAVGKAAKVIRDALQNMAASCKQLLVNPAAADVSAPAAAAFAVTGLLAHILAWICIVGRLLGNLKNTAVLLWGPSAAEYLDKLFRGVYASAAWGGCVTFLVPLAIAILIPLMGQLLRKEQADIPACAVAGISSCVLPSAVFLAAGLLCLVVPQVGLMLVSIAVMTGLVTFYRQIARELKAPDAAWKVLLIAVLLVVIAAVVAWAAGGVVTGYLRGTFAANLNDTVNFMDILKYILGSLF